MSVSVTKNGFNVREKLKQLQKPIGLKGSELMRAETAQEARDFVSAGRKNLIINGDMRISQRGTTFNPVASSTGIYTIDRFCTQSLQSNNFTITQDSSSPPGFLNNWKITMGTATTLNYTRLCATVEGYHFKQASAFGTSLAKHLTLSFWVKSSLTGTFGIGFRNGTTIQGTGLSTSLLSTYTINSANTWEYKTITIPPNTEATWGLSNNIGFLIMWDLGDSNTRSSSVTNTWQTSDSYYPVGLTNGTKVASVTGATWQITGVQLEVGKNATEFEHRSYGEELALCQRYCYVIRGDAPAATTGAVSVGHGVWNGTNGAYILVRHPVLMRDTPTLDYGNIGWYRVVAEAVTWKGVSTLSIQGDGSSTNSTTLYAGVGTNNSDSRGFGARMTTQTTAAKFILSAEL